VTLHHRTDFAASMIDGRTVMEVDPKGRSAQEVTALWTYISERLERNFRRTVFAVPAQPAPVIGSAQRCRLRPPRQRFVKEEPDDRTSCFRFADAKPSCPQRRRASRDAPAACADFL
jgi:hypothetical protein